MSESKFAIVVHGGAGPDSAYIRTNIDGYNKGLEAAVQAGYEVLEKGGSAVDAVEAAVNSLEDNPLFNAGRGAAINAKAEIEMCASIMNGKDLKCGAIAIVKNVRNPVTLARNVMEKTQHIYLGSHGALSFAQEINARLEPDSYFITEHQYDAYEEQRKKVKGDEQSVAKQQIGERMHGTVGAVALDKKGTIAAATSTGGTEYAKEGRIGDSSMVGIGSYANNETCAVSSTGDGEYIIRHTTAFHVAALMEYKGLPLKEAAHYLIQEKLRDVGGDIGIICIDPKGTIALEFNSERMHRGYRTSDGAFFTGIY
ncbi:MAG TPA: isoaspartyl peptidase/L-asparaginase [Flavisolibacter sp.]|jgi:beta-aspartyl-peptidase (threonine type)|nr:isoaspartyl peptidase/L-asparaginase [Flavisolibacter sp.]